MLEAPVNSFQQNWEDVDQEGAWELGVTNQENIEQW